MALPASTPSTSTVDGGLVAMADAAPSSGIAGGREAQARNEAHVAALLALCASDLSAHLAAGDRRGGVMALREMVKRWACSLRLSDFLTDESMS